MFLIIINIVRMLILVLVRKQNAHSTGYITLLTHIRPKHKLSHLQRFVYGLLSMAKLPEPSVGVRNTSKAPKPESGKIACSFSCSWQKVFVVSCFFKSSHTCLLKSFCSSWPFFLKEYVFSCFAFFAAFWTASSWLVWTCSSSCLSMSSMRCLDRLSSSRMMLRGLAISAVDSPVLASVEIDAPEVGRDILSVKHKWVLRPRMLV